MEKMVEDGASFGGNAEFKGGARASQKSTGSATIILSKGIQ
jgi:hypothetical protein